MNLQFTGNSNNDVCKIKLNMKTEEVQFLKDALNNTQKELNVLKGNMRTNGKDAAQIKNLQKIIDELNDDLSDTISKNAHQNIKRENEELQETVNTLQNQVSVMNQTIESLRNNAVLADRLNGDNNKLNQTVSELTEQLNQNGAQLNILQSKAKQADTYKAQNAKLQIIAATLKQQLGGL